MKCYNKCPHSRYTKKTGSSNKPCATQQACSSYRLGFQCSRCWRSFFTTTTLPFRFAVNTEPKLPLPISSTAEISSHVNLGKFTISGAGFGFVRPSAKNGKADAICLPLPQPPHVLARPLSCMRREPVGQRYYTTWQRGQS